MEVEQDNTELDFVHLGLVTNEARLAQVVKVLNDLYSNSPADVSHAMNRGPSSASDLGNDSIALLLLYQFSWRPYRGVFFFLRTRVSYPLRALLIAKPDLEDASRSSELYATALEILDEFMSALDYWDKLKKYKSEQRKLLSRKHKEFFDLLVLRDGRKCADCNSTRKKLCIDHIKPISKGGRTELVNLRLLCNGCNSKKSNSLAVATL